MECPDDRSWAAVFIREVSRRGDVFFVLMPKFGRN